MNKIPTSEIKKLRDITGAGFLDCKEAIEKSDYNIDKACDIFSKNSEPINNDYLSKFNIYLHYI